ncbi:MAG TPA: acetate--CoA ligase family protein [Acidimicrobiales bacterium]|nr:acetate--CoA ligase family protein [Acidimicrobiales bacterium]
MPPDAVPPDVDVSGRPVTLEDADLDRFFHPTTVAVVGASDEEGRPNTGITRQLHQWAQRMGATFFPVHPKRATVFDTPCVPSVAALPDGVDVLAFVVSDPVDAIRQAAGKGFGFAVVFTAGFAELGADGRAAQAALTAEVRATGMRLLGPNTNLNAFEQFRTDLDGPAVALISQSGHQGRPIFQTQELGVRLAYWAPTGNEGDLEVADFVRYFADQPKVGAIAAYVEGFKDGRSLLLAADHAARRKVPVVMVKVGRTEEGRSMAGSHTGKLAGADAVAGAALRQAGIVRVEGLDELADTAVLLARARPPTGDGVVITSISGGTGAHMADVCASRGLRLPRLSQATQDRLHEWIPSYLRVSNPVDNGGHPVGDWRGRKILDTLVADPDVGVLVAPITGAFPPMSDKLAQDLVDVAETTDKPVCVIWGSPVGTEAAYRDILLGSRKIAVFRTFANCATAVRAYFDYYDFQRRYRSPFAGLSPAPSAAPSAARAVAEGVLAERAPSGGALSGGALSKRTLSEWDSGRVLQAYGIRTPAARLCTSADEAVAAAADVGYPVVLKACGGAVAHKSDAGLVRLGVADAAAVAAAYDDLVARAPVAIEGVIVAEMVGGGVETVVGLSQDPVFGPTVMVGLGGVLVEVLGDVAFRVPPFDRDEARRMVAELKGFPLLTGVRGRWPADVEALLDAVMAVQAVGMELAGTVAEVDVNPLLVLDEGRGAVALDALVVVEHGGTEDG